MSDEVEKVQFYRQAKAALIGFPAKSRLDGNRNAKRHSKVNHRFTSRTRLSVALRYSGASSLRFASGMTLVRVQDFNWTTAFVSVKYSGS